MGQVHPTYKFQVEFLTNTIMKIFSIFSPRKIAITHEIHKNVDAPSSVDTITVFSDMLKAFDKVCHKGFICKFQSYGIQSKILTFQKQRVILNGVTSSWKSIKSGLPQGSILGPLLFLIFINDLPDNLICKPKSLGDNVSLNAVIVNKDLCTKNLKDDLSNLYD